MAAEWVVCRTTKRLDFINDAGPLVVAVTVIGSLRGEAARCWVVPTFACDSEQSSVDLDVRVIERE